MGCCCHLPCTLPRKTLNHPSSFSRSELIKDLILEAPPLGNNYQRVAALAVDNMSNKWAVVMVVAKATFQGQEDLVWVGCV